MSTKKNPSSREQIDLEGDSSGSNEISSSGTGESPEPISSAKPHRRIYQVGAMRIPVKDAPLRDSPRGKLVAKYKEILKKGRKPSSSASDTDAYEPPRRPASSRPTASSPGIPIGFPRFRREAPEPFQDDDEDD